MRSDHEVREDESCMKAVPHADGCLPGAGITREENIQRRLYGGLHDRQKNIISDLKYLNSGLMLLNEYTVEVNDLLMNMMTTSCI